ncbi:MAG: endonuclease III [Actinomycetia bacterium]|nr:endonuclease III [Actinomycetes bacterium]
MPRETKSAQTARALEIARRLAELYPEARPSLSFHDPFTLLIAVLLSAQTTDAAVNQVTPELFERWPDAAGLATADPQEIAQVIRRIGFYQVKARHCQQAAQLLMADFGGQVPQTPEELLRLPGVGRKTANIILTEGFGVVDGIAVDTHVFRIAHRLGLARAKSQTPNQVERDLQKVFPQSLWADINRRWILLGRQYCQARRPQCGICPLLALCPSALE